MLTLDRVQGLAWTQTDAKLPLSRKVFDRELLRQEYNSLVAILS